MEDPALRADAARLANAIGEEIGANRGVAELDALALSRSLVRRR
jgi:hypothetical protein